MFAVGVERFSTALFGVLVSALFGVGVERFEKPGGLGVERREHPRDSALFGLGHKHLETALFGVGVSPP